MRKLWKRVTLGAWLLGLVAASTLVVAGAATANHQPWHGYSGSASSHVQVDENARCPEGTADAGNLVIDGGQLASGVFGGRIEITKRALIDQPEGQADAFSWQLVDQTLEVMAVIVKGGPGAIIYYYSGPDKDSNLTPPKNPGDSYPQISHVEFCFDPKEAPEPVVTVEKSANGTSQIQHSWDVDKQVKVAGAADATYGDNASLNLADGGAGSFTWKVTVTHSQAQTYAVTGTITVSNDGAVQVTGVDVSDSIPGASISCAGGGSTNLTVPANGSVECTYSVAPGSQVANNTATASWGDGESATDTATIQWTEPTVVGVPATVKDGGDIDESLDLDDLEGNAWTETYDERWTCSNGTPSPNAGRTNTATVTWDGGSDSDSAAVQVGCGSTPPPPPPPPPPPTVKTDEFMDVQVIKDATPQVQLVNGQADIAYTIRVKNNGPNQAHQVKLVDAAPSGVTFLAVTQQPANGSCSVSGGALLQCSLGTLGPGVERTIGLSARVTQTGTYVNSATGTGDGKDTNAANNTDDARTLVTAPVTPPVAKPPAKPKPKPSVKPAPDICRVLKVTPGLVKANGRQQLVLAKVTRSKTPVKGVAVRFSGNGLAKVVKTNANGVAKLGIAPSKAGIVLVRITSTKACNTARIGVVGVFEPPVTG